MTEIRQHINTEMILYTLISIDEFVQVMSGKRAPTGAQRKVHDDFQGDSRE